jgi:hypothetical protein
MITIILKKIRTKCSPKSVAAKIVEIILDVKKYKNGDSVEMSISLP